MPRKNRVDEGEHGFEVEITIPARHSRRARDVEERLGPVEPVPAPKPGPRIPRITRLMALAIKLQEMIDRGEIQDYVDITRLGYITRARATQIMNLTLLAPDIQEALIEPQSALSFARGATERELRLITRHAHWTEQRKAWSDLRSRWIPSQQTGAEHGRK